MKLTRDEFDAHFAEYRDALQREVGHFRNAASVLRQIDDRTRDYLAELNLAPAFFTTVESALFTTVVLWADKLFDERGDRGLFNFLKLIEYNRDWMTVKELQRRRNFPDDHWVLRPENRGAPITAEYIESDRAKIRGLAALKSIRIRRDKFHGHFDKGFFFDRKKLGEEAPIEWPALKEAGEVMASVVNSCSADFDGNVHKPETMGIDDLTRLLRAAQKGTGK